MATPKNAEFRTLKYKITPNGTVKCEQKWGWGRRGAAGGGWGKKWGGGGFLLDSPSLTPPPADPPPPPPTPLPARVVDDRRLLKNI